MNRIRLSSIPGVETFHRREVIEALSYPVDGPQSRQDVWDTYALHYTGADDLIDGDPGETADDQPAYLAGIQRHYEERRGYSVGYQFAVDWLGGVWELRGWDINCAANRGWNDRTVAVLCLVDGNDPVTAEAVRSINAIWLEAQRRSLRTLALKPHSAIGSTACPGNGIRAQITASKFKPEAFTPTPKPPPSEEDEYMELFMKTAAVRHHARTGAFFLTSALDFVQHLDQGQINHYIAMGIELVPLSNEDVFESYVSYLSSGARPDWAGVPAKP